MDVLNPQYVPCLALIIGNESALSSLQSSFTSFPHGVTYPQFRSLLLTYLPPAMRSARRESTINTEAVSLTAPPFFPPSDVPHNGSLPKQDAATAATAAVTASLTAAAAPPSLHLPPLAQDGQDANREEARLRRLCTRHELAGTSAVPVDPIKQLFNRIDIYNEQRVTWDNVLNYVVAEAGAGVAEARYSANRTKIYSFSRALRCPTKQHRPLTAAPPQQLQDGGDTNIPQSTSRETPAFKRFHPALHETKIASASGNAPAESSNPIHVEEDLCLIRILDGLESHNAVFFISARSHPFLLYSKDSLERVFTAPPEMLGEGFAPTTVAYLASIDLFLCYSTDDRLLRGWLSLLAPSVVTVAVHPMLVEGFVRRMQIMPVSSPTYAEYAESVFLGDSYGHVLHVTAPRGRGGGMEFAVQHMFKGLHSRASGGLVDFCVFGANLYSSGFDGRVVATNLVTGQSSEIGSVAHEHLHALVFVPAHGGLVAATSSTRQLLWWEAGVQSALPGVPFEHAGYGEHAAAIVSVVYVASSDYLASADCDGVVKVWEMATHRCVQSFQSHRMTRGEAGSFGGTEEATPGTTLKSQGRAKRGNRPSSSPGFAASAGRDMMMLTHNGLHSLLSESAGAGHVGVSQCHSLAYCAETEELLCGFANAIACWGLHGNKNPYLCDTEEVCQDVQYDVRSQSFVLRSATRLSVWDSAHGVRRGFLDRTKLHTSSHARADIKAVCVDDLGSRVFLAAGDGNVYTYATHELTTDAAADMDEASHLWSAAAVVVGVDGKPTPVLVEQMYYSATLRTWMAITSCGTLLVRTEADSQRIVSSATVNVSAVALTQMRVSEELGLVAVLDAQRTVFLYDMEAWSDAPETKSLASFGRVVEMTFLDAAPVLVSVHAGGVCRCWSCPPAVECFELLAVIRHPLLPPPVVKHDEGADSLLYFADTSAGASMAASAPPVEAPGCMQEGGVGAAVATRPTTAPALAATTYSRPLTASLRSRPVSSSRETSRNFLGKTLAAERRSGKSTLVSANDRGERFSASGSRLLPSASRGVGKKSGSASGVADATIAAPRGNRSMSPETLIMDTEARTKALASEMHEFTSVSYDGESHHLFLGDAHGVVHLYRMCPLLQFYKLPRCSYAVRPAFTLFSDARERPMHMEGTRWKGDDGSVANDDDPGVTTAASPLLVRSVDVHVRYRDRPVARRRGMSVSAAMARLPQPSVRTKLRKDEAGGVACVRWLASRGVLATCGNDHEVWLLNAEGDRLAFLSAERLLPRPKAPISQAALSTSLPGRAPAPDSMAASVLSSKSYPQDDALPLQRPFSLPPVQPASREADALQAPHPSTQEYCTHPAHLQEAPPQPFAKSGPVPFSRDASAATAAEEYIDVPDLYAADVYSPPPPLPDADTVSAATERPPLTRSTRALADYLAMANSKSLLDSRNGEESVANRPTAAAQGVSSLGVFSAGAAVSCVSRAATGVSSGPAGCSPKLTAVTKSSGGIPVNLLPESVCLTSPRRLADAAGAAENRTFVPVAPSTLNCDSSGSSLSEDPCNGLVDASCSRISGHPAAPTLTNMTSSPSPGHPAVLTSVGAFVRGTSAGRSPHAPELEDPTHEASLWITGVPLGHAAAPAHLLDSSCYASKSQPKSRFLELSARGLPRPGRLALFASLRPHTTDSTTQFHSRRVGEADVSAPSLPSAPSGCLIPSLPRAATASHARPPVAASKSPMLAYSTPKEGLSTLELYSRELRQRLRRPRPSE